MKGFWQEFRSIAVAGDKAAATLLFLFALIGVSAVGADWLLGVAPVHARDAQERAVPCPGRSQRVRCELAALVPNCEVDRPMWNGRPSSILLRGGLPEPRAPDVARREFPRGCMPTVELTGDFAGSLS